MLGAFDLLCELIEEIGKVLLEEGEGWRLEHGELLDAYDAAITFITNRMSANDGT